MYDLLFNGVGLGQVAYAFVRIATGLFFAISGYHKLFNPQRHATLVATLEADGVPLLKVNQWFVPMVEMGGGVALVIGLLTPIAAIGLACICTVACVVDGVKRIKGWGPIDKADYIDDLLYLPELVYIMILVLLITKGGGDWSVDHILYTHLFGG
jgi:uncharacterized membrane protein YphA (DoxX/SURF4 family)